jgi:plasmid maintenance system antidote protein VapI
LRETKENKVGAMQSQLSIPSAVTPAEVAREQTLGGAIDLCAKAAGFDFDKTLQLALGVDKGQFSRWGNGSEGIKWPTLIKLMDHCGNDAPVLWMVHQRGYDLNAMRRRETELERANRQLREENAALRRVLVGQGTP